MRTQGQHWCQIFHKIVSNCVPISDFATRQLNLTKTSKIFKKIVKTLFFLSFKNVNFDQRNICRVYSLSIFDIWFTEYIKMGHRNEPNDKMGAWWQNLRLVHNLTLFSGIFDTYIEPGNMLIRVNLV